MSDCFDHDYEAMCSMEEHFYGAGEDSLPIHSSPSCSYCGKGNLKWGEHNGKPRLMERVGNLLILHICKEYQETSRR